MICFGGSVVVYVMHMGHTILGIQEVIDGAVRLNLDGDALPYWDFHKDLHRFFAMEETTV